ncbi:MAG TPA: hypothetical protein VLT13_04250 [Bacteroidota bacterium]|nr:hypothetical protein [Bacteroidota bacterium]
MFALPPPAARLMKPEWVSPVQTAPESLEPIPELREKPAIALTGPDVQTMSSEPAVVKQRSVEKAGPQTARLTERAGSEMQPEAAFFPLSEATGARQALSRVPAEEKPEPKDPMARMRRPQAAKGQMLKQQAAGMQGLKPRRAAGQMLKQQAAGMQTLKPRLAAGQMQWPRTATDWMPESRAATAQMNGELTE